MTLRGAVAAVASEIGAREISSGLGLASLAVGFWMAWPPLAPIVVGVLLLAAGAWPGRRR